MATILYEDERTKDFDKSENIGIAKPTYHLTSVFPTKEIQEEVDAFLAQ